MKAFRAILIYSLPAIIIGCFGLAYFAKAVFNEKIDYQGKITDSAGVAIADGDYCMKFLIQPAATGDASVWSEEWKAVTEKVTVTSGLFSVMLGSSSTLSNLDFDSNSLYLEVRFDANPVCDGVYEELFYPYKQLGTVPAAFQAKELDGYTWAYPGSIGSATADAGAFTTLSASGAFTTSNGSILSSASETLSLGGTGGTYHENLTMNFDGAANTVIFGSTSSVATLDFGAFRLATTGHVSMASGEYGAATNYISYDGTNNLIFQDAVTGSKTLAELAAATSLLGDYDLDGGFLTIDGDGDTQLRAYTDDIISLDIGGGATGEYLFSATTLDAASNILKTTASGDFGYVTISDETQGYKVDNLMVISNKGASGSENLFLGQSGNFTTTGTNNIFAGYQSGNALTSGVSNIGIGFNSGLALTTSNFNTLIGYQSGKAIVASGDANTFLGYNTGIVNTTNDNTFIGYNVGAANTSATGQVFIGYGAGDANSTGANNTFIGWNSGTASTTSAGHVFVGYNSGAANTTGAGNTFMGWTAGLANTVSNFNVLVGYQSGKAIVASGDANTFLGYNTGIVNTTNDNTFIGYNVGAANTSATGQVFIGYGAGDANSTGANNTFIGWNAGTASTTSANHVFVGYNAGAANTTGSSNTYIGWDAGLAATVSNFNTLIGYQSGKAIVASGDANTFLGYNTGIVNTANDNTFIGYNVGAANTSATGQVFIGYGAGDANSTGANNTFIGWNAGTASTTSANHVFVGYNAGAANTTGSSNTYIGWDAGLAATVSNFNTLIGYQSGKAIVASGDANTFLGYNTGQANTSGYDNTLVGYSAGYTNTTGLGNTFLGYGAGYTNSTGSSNVFLGYNAGYYETGSGKLFIDNTARASEADARAKALAYGIFNADTANQYLYINGNAVVLGTMNSAGYTLGGAAVAGTILRGNGTSFVASTATYPATTTINQLLYSSGANVIAGLATINSGVLVTSAGGVPSIATDIPTAVTIGGGAYIYRVSGTDVSVADGGTGRSVTTAYALIAGGTTTTSAMQSIANSAATGAILQSAGTSALSTWSTATYPATTTIYQLLYSTATNVVGGSAGLTYDGSTLTAGTGTEVFTVLDTGNIGIGDTSPDYPLEILSTTNPQFAISYTDGTAYATAGVSASGDMTFSASGGNIKMAGVGGTYNEDLNLNFEGAADTVIFSSTTGAATLDFGAFRLTTTGHVAMASGEFGAATNYISYDGANNLIFQDAVTGSKTLAELAAGGGVPDGNDFAIQFAKDGAFAGTDEFSWNTDTNLLTVTGKVFVSASAEFGVATNYITYDGANNMIFSDAVAGTKTLTELAAGGAPSGDYDLNGGFLTIDATGNTQLRAYADNIVSLDIGGGATGEYLFSATELNLASNNLTTTGHVSMASGEYGAATNYISYDAANNLIFQDAVTGSKTLAELAAATALLGDYDLNGGFLTIDATGNTKLRAYADNIVSLDIGGGATGEYLFSATALDLASNNLTTTGHVSMASGEFGAATNYISYDGANNLIFQDAVTGSKTLAELAAGGSGDYDLDGGFLTIDATGNTKLRAYADNIVSLDIGGGATGEYLFSATELNLASNNLTTTGNGTFGTVYFGNSTGVSATAATGVLTFAGLAGGGEPDENFILNFERDTNSIVFSSGTGVGTMDFSAFAIKTTGTGSFGNLTATATSGAQLTSKYNDSNYATFTVGATGNLAIAAVGATGDITFAPGSAGDPNFLSDSGRLVFGGYGGTNNEDLKFDFETVADIIGLSSSTSAGTIDFGAFNFFSTTTGRLGQNTWTADGDVAVYKNNATGLIGVQNPSDARLKTNVATIDGAMDIIKGINGVTFNWINRPDETKKTVGVLAQDVMKVMPELTYSFVSPDDGETYYGVYYEKLSVVLINALKEQYAVVEEQQKVIDEIKELMSISDMENIANGSASGDMTAFGDAGNTTINILSFKDAMIKLIKDTVLSMGIIVTDGVAQAKEMIIDKITAKTIVLDNLDAKTIRVERIEMKDQKTGEIYCTWVENGEVKKAKGDCSSIVITDSPQTPVVPPPTPPPTPDPNQPPTEPTDPAPATDPVVPAPVTAPAPAPDPAPAPAEAPVSPAPVAESGI